MEISHSHCLSDFGLETDAVPIYDTYKFKEIENISLSSENSVVAQINSENNSDNKTSTRCESKTVNIVVENSQNLSKNYQTGFCSKSKCAVNTKRPKCLSITQEMQCSYEKIPPQMFSTIAMHIGFGWKDLMKELNHPDGEVFNAVTDNHFMGNKEIRYHLLLNWQKCDRNPTIGHIVHVLLRCGRHDVVILLEKDYKLMKNENRQWNYC